MKEIIVCAFPKSGLTWLIHLLCDLLDAPQQDTPGGEIVGCWGVHCDGDYVIRKSHDAYQPEKHSGKTVALIQRDPRDIIVSKSYYLRLSLDSAIEMTLKDYEPWIRSWLDSKAYTVLTRYRWLQEKPAEELRRIVWTLTGKTLDDPTIQIAVERQSFENMRKQLGDDYHFMRRGIMGDWRNHLTRQQGKRIAKALNQFMLEQKFVDDIYWWKELPDEPCR